MLAFRVSSVVLLYLSCCEAQSYTNSSSFPSQISATSIINSTITNSPSLPTSSIFQNQTHHANGTTNACQAAFDSWTTDWWWWIPTTQLEWVGTETYDYRSTISSTEIFDCTQTCGSICYAGPITTIVSTTHISRVETRTYGANPSYEVPRPNCTIGFEDCLSIQSSWSSAITSYSAMPLEYQVYNIEPPPPACSACVSTACTFVGMFGVSLYYWPATTSVTRDYCASEPIGGPNTAYLPDINHTYVPITTGAYEIVDGITMYEGNIYLSYQEPRVEDNCGKDVTRQAPGHNVLTIASGDLHSLRKFPHALAPFPVTWDLVPWPVNFDDFTPPTPFSAYAGQRECAQPGLNTSSCTIVKPNEYYPYMLMPPQIRDLDPNWKNCLFDKYAAFDPPIALRTRGNMFSTVNAQPTSIKPVDPVHTPPMPGQSSGGGIAVPTTRPDDPSSPETQPPQDHNDDVHNSPPSRPQEPAVNSPTRTGTPKPNELNVLPRPVITVGPSTIMIDSSSRLVVQPGLTLKDGDPPVTVDGTVLSVGPSGIVLVGPKGTSTIQIPANANTGQLVTIGSATYTIANGELILGSKLTLSMSGAAVILSGTTISLASEGVMVVKSSSTTIIPIESTGAVTNEQDAAPSRDAEDSKDTYRTANSASRFTRQVAQLPLLALAIGLLIAPSLYT